MRAFVLNPSFLLFYHQLISTFYKFVIIGKCCLITQLPIAITHIPIKNEYIISFSGTSLIYDKDKNHLLTSSSRNRVITQVLWQIEGRTMFVAKWEPGVIPEKPELKSAPIWLELRNVPFQFFNEDGLERVAGLVGHPKFLHPSTANKTNLEVAKVFTIIDPRLPLPEAVNVQFDSGDICRVLVSSPWMPPICGQCNDIGHNTRSCKKAPKLCASCKSETHETSNCPKVKPASANGSGKKTRRGRSTSKARIPQVPQGNFSSTSAQVYRPKLKSNGMIQGRQSVLEEGGTSNSSQRPEDSETIGHVSPQLPTKTAPADTGASQQTNTTHPHDPASRASSVCSDAEPDSSDTDSSGSDEEKGEILEYVKDPSFKMKNRHSGRNKSRGKAPSNL